MAGAVQEPSQRAPTDLSTGPGPSVARATGTVPAVSVVICAFNAAATVRECLVSLQRVTNPHFETIVVDDGSTDHTAAIARTFSDVTLIQTPNQ